MRWGGGKRVVWRYFEISSYGARGKGGSEVHQGGPALATAEQQCSADSQCTIPITPSISNKDHTCTD